MKTHLYLISGALVLAVIAVSSCSETKNKKGFTSQRTLSLDNMYTVLLPEEKIALGKAFDTLADAVHAAYMSKSDKQFLAATTTFLHWSNRVPIFFLENHFDEFSRRLDSHGVAPYLSLCIDLGRRLAELRTDESLRKYDDLIDRFSGLALKPEGRVTILRREGNLFATNPDNNPAQKGESSTGRVSSSKGSYYRAYSDNVGVAVASLLFSDFGRNMNLFTTRVDLDRYLALATFVASCSDCAREKLDENPFESSRTGFAHNAKARNFSRTPTRLSKSVQSCESLNYALLRGMTEKGAENLKNSACDVRKNGFTSSSPDRLRDCLAQYEDALGPSDMEKSFAQFEEYLGCLESYHTDRGERNPFFHELATYASGPIETELCLILFCYKTKIEVDPDDGHPTKKTDTLTFTLSSAYYRIWEKDYDAGTETATESKQESGVTTTVQVKTKDGEVVSKTTTKSYDNGTTVTNSDTKDWNTEKVKGKDGKTYYKTTNNETGETSYGVDDGGTSTPITKEEYEAAKKKNEPTTTPDPSGPATPCEQAFFKEDPPTIKDDDLGPWVNPDPNAPVDDEALQALMQLFECMEPDESPVCHTYMMCADEPNVDQCTCENYLAGPGLFGGCDGTLIRCPEGTRLEGCLCVSFDGDVIPPIGNGFPSGPRPTLLGISAEEARSLFEEFKRAPR